MCVYVYLCTYVYRNVCRCMCVPMMVDTYVFVN